MNVRQSVEQSMSTIKTTINKFEHAQKYIDRTENKNWSQNLINELRTAYEKLSQCR